jgi:hypothetical protein
MREWLGKPLLILAGILVVLSGASALYLKDLPRATQAADSGGSFHQRQVEQACRLVEDR